MIFFEAVQFGHILASLTVAIVITITIVNVGRRKREEREGRPANNNAVYLFALAGSSGESVVNWRNRGLLGHFYDMGDTFMT